ncbi:MAG TPA: ABC transporter substrate-binding protein [Solirubrobacteraceae bacterium]|nr:ABC transporter substrate-binding protein [Solirubrobacteraceae bacterium]
MTRSFRSWFAVPVVLLCVGAIAACGSSSSSSSTSGSSTTQSTSTAGTKAASVAALVPASIESKGTLTVAADASYAPNEFIGSDGHTVVGMDADLSKALGALMGLKVSVVNATFDTIIPGLSAGKYDMGASSFTDTKAREKVVVFVDYFEAGTSFFTKSSGGTSVTGLAQLCGKTVSVESGTTEETDAKGQSATCAKAGKPKVNVLVFPTQTAANLALSSGRAQISMADSPVAAYQVKQSNGTFKLVGQPYGTAPYGLALPKTSGLAPAVLAALKELMANGTYTSILTKWGIQSGAIPASAVKINGATS